MLKLFILDPSSAAYEKQFECCKLEILRRGGIFAIWVKIQDLQQIFRIVKMLVKMEYLHWVEGTPQLCPFPSVILKLGLILMVLHNLDAHHGLCNGTRVCLIEMKSRLLKVSVLHGYG